MKAPKIISRKNLPIRYPFGFIAVLLILLENTCAVWVHWLVWTFTALYTFFYILVRLGEREFQIKDDTKDDAEDR